MSSPKFTFWGANSTLWIPSNKCKFPGSTPNSSKGNRQKMCTSRRHLMLLLLSGVALIYQTLSRDLCGRLPPTTVLITAVPTLSNRKQKLTSQQIQQKSRSRRKGSRSTALTTLTWESLYVL